MLQEKKWFAGSAVLFAAAYAVYLYAAVISGGSPGALLVYQAALTVGVVLAGYTVVKRLLPGVGFRKLLPVSFTAGCVLLYLCYIAARGQRWVLLLPLLLGLASLKETAQKLRRYQPCCADAVLLATLACFTAAYVLCAVLPFARADKLTNFAYHQDMLWSVGNAAAAKLGFPIQDMRFAGTTLNYHYLNDVTAGILAFALGDLPAYESLCFYWYLPVVCVLVLSLYELARRFTAHRTFAALVPAGVLFGVGSTGVFQYVTNINGMGTATISLCAVFALCAELDDAAAFRRLSLPRKLGFYLLGYAVGFGCSMFKSTIGALACLAMLAAALAGLPTRKSGARHFALAAVSGAGFATAYLLVFCKAVNNLVFSGWQGLWQLPHHVLKAGGVIAVVYLAAMLYSLARFSKLRFDALVANAMAIGGALAVSLYTHYSASQVYFVLIAVPMMLVCCLPLLDRLCGQNRLAWRGAAAVLAVWMGVNCLSLLPNARSGVQALLRIYHLRVSDYTEENITAQDYDAMLWLKNHSAAEDIFATNRNNKQYAAGEGVFHYYTAASERRCYLESYRYCMDYSGMYHEVRRRLEQVSDRIFHEYGEDEAFAVAGQEGIDWLVVFTPVNEPAWRRTPAYENDTVKIYRVSE